MAAVLKKRVIAEFTQVIQEDATPPPHKKLRLHHRGRGKPPHLELHSTSDVQEALQRLVKFEENLPVGLEFVDQIMQTLLDHYYKAQDASLRAKIASLMGQLSKTPGYTATVLLSDLHSMLNNEKSHKVVCQLLTTLLVMGESAPQDNKLHFQILEMTRKYLKTNAHSVRVKCLELIGGLGTPGMRAADAAAAASTSATTSALPLEDIMQKYVKDSDPRVRTAAFSALLRWHQRGLPLEQAVYGRLVEALKDDYEGVRLAALKLIWVVCQLYPEVIIPVADGEDNLRMIDDGFGQICHLVNDQSMRVRMEAAGLLGSLHGVSQRFLEQTLDKKLMSDMRRKKSAHERHRENFESGEWSTGKKWADDRPQESLDAAAINVISSGACGALVHGLEDEYLEVRNAAIDSLCELANQSASFANKCQDYLVDMFNDEIEAIRLNAINSIRKISHHVMLREDQLDLVLSVFKDYNPEIRHALREMFSCIKFATKSSLHNCILALLDNLKRYPQDSANVWRCAQHLGRNNAFMSLPLITELLSAHPFFDCPEPDVDDPAYVSILIMVFNAAQTTPTMCQLFPEHISRHYRYLRDTLPDLVPPLTGLSVSNSALSSVSPPETLTSGFLEQTMRPLSQLDRLPTAHLIQLIPRVARDLSRISEVDKTYAANAECMRLYLECQLCLAKLLSPECAVCVDSPSTSGQSPETASLLNRVFHYCHQMEHLFVGLSLIDMGSVQQLHLRAHTIRLLKRLQNSGGQDNKHACAQFLMMLNHLQKHLSNNCLTVDNFTTSLLSQLHRLETCEPSIFISVLQMSLRLHRPSILCINTQLRRATATITQHSATRDNDNRFTAGLTTNVQLTAELQNVTEAERVRLQVHYPDQRMQWTLPRTGAWRQTSPLHYELNTEIPLSHGAWSEPCQVELCIVMGYNPDSNLYDDASDMPISSEASEENVLELCRPIKVQMLPKPARR